MGIWDFNSDYYIDPAGMSKQRPPTDYMLGAPLEGGPTVADGGFVQGGSTGGGTAQSQADAMKKLGLFTAVVGGINSAIGSYYAAKSAQYQAKSRSSSYQFQSDMAGFNASAAEADARSVLEAGKTEIGRYTMRAGQEKASVKAAIGSRGVALGVGSTRDIEASMDLVKELDTLTINSNAVRAAEARRTQAQNYRTQATMYGVSSQNARMSADSISPFASLSSSLINSAGTIASHWRYRNSGGYDD